MLSVLQGVLASKVCRRHLISGAMAAMLAFGMASFCARLDAQVTFGSVLETVSDPSGGTVAGATVKLTNLGTNGTESVETGSGGTYTFPNLSAGQYQVEIEAAGFKRFTKMEYRSKSVLLPASMRRCRSAL